MKCEEFCPECEEDYPTIPARYGVLIGIVIGLLIVLIAGFV